ncbi:response regulator [Archaeoglobales archaeon]|nr:MAG: response regulator [Archaeoglobales archaeon]
MKVLIVEDDIALLEALKLMLSNFDVEIAVNGKDAIEKYKSFKPDIVLMDIVMPEISGIEATREILKMDGNAKVLAITAFAKHKGKEMLEAGALEIIEKPFSKSELIERIKKYVDT